jgi:hypothetical protein
MINIAQGIIVLALVALSPTLYAQELSGQWNGSLETPGATFHIVFHIREKGNAYEATLDSPDQNATGIPVTTVTRKGPDIKLQIPAIGMLYEGLLSDNRISGNWMQSGMTFPLILEKATPATEKKE